MERIAEPQFRDEYGKAEKERLYKRMDKMQVIEEQVKGQPDAWFFKGDALYLLAENKRLREALINIKKHQMSDVRFNGHSCSDIAKEALREEGK